MTNMQTWQAFLVLDEAHWQFLGLSPWPDQLLRWCRKFLRGFARHNDLRRTEVVIYSRDDRPRASRWTQGSRPFRWVTEHGWQREKVFQHPFEELLSKRDKTPSNGTVPVAGQRRLGRRMTISSPTVGSGTAFDEPAPSTDAVEPQSAAVHNNLLYWLSAAGAGRWDAFLRHARFLDLPRIAVRPAVSSAG